MKWWDLGALFTPSEKTKLAGIEDSATADQTNTEIRDAVEAATNSNTFDNADHTKLNGIDTGAKDDQTGAEIKTAYEGQANAYTDTKDTKLAGIDTGANVTGDNPPQLHGAGSHTNRTRTIFLSTPHHTTGATDRKGIGLDPAGVEYASYRTKLPTHFVSLTNIYVWLYTGESNTGRFDLALRYGEAGQAYSNHFETDNDNDIALTINDLLRFTTSGLGGNLTINDVLTMDVAREGSHANDNVTVDIYVVGIEIEYESDE